MEKIQLEIIMINQRYGDQVLKLKLQKEKVDIAKIQIEN